MAELQREKGRLTEVFHPHGSFPDGLPRFRRASYDLLEWSSVSGGKKDTYVVPIGFVRITALDLNDFAEGTVSGDATDVGQEFGFYTSQRVIVEPHQADGSDSWIGLQFFGPI